MFNNKKYSGGQSNSFNFKREFKNIQLGTVVTVGKVPVSNESEVDRKRDERFNADQHAIRVRIIGGRYDNNNSDSKLPNCYPILPKHLNVRPKVGEIVLVFIFGEDEAQSDRWYIGPFVSSETKLNHDTADTNAMSTLSYGLTSPPEEISKIPLAKGIYEDPKHIVIEGRNNTDIIQRDEEILIRSGKFITPKEFNSENPGYIQLKFNHQFNEIGSDKPKSISVTNVVANKINLLTYPSINSTGGTVNLTYIDNDSDGAAKYISDNDLNDILNYAHPLVFGDILVEYLSLFRNAFINHVHNPAGDIPTDKGGNPLELFKNKAKQLEKEMLSKNIRIN